MKKRITLIIIAFSLTCSFAQTNEEIAGVYIHKAEKNLKEQDLTTAEENFNKALVLLDHEVKQQNVDRLGTLINYLQGKFTDAKKFAKHYFQIAEDKTTEEYTEQLELFVEIEEKIDSINEVNAEIERKRIAHVKELARVKSLKEDWDNKSNKLSFTAQEVGHFNKNGITTVKNNNFYGVINDKAVILVEPNKYKDFRFFDEYILLLDKKENATEILCYNTKTAESFKVPNVSSFNKISTTYGIVTSPRGSHKLITYPNNTTHTLIFDLQTKEFNTITDYKAILKPLKSEDIIDSYNKKEQIKINKQWYYFGGDIGGGIYTIYGEDLSLHGYLFHVDSSILTKKEVGYLGGLHHNILESSKNNQTSWIDAQKNKVNTPINENGIYSGLTKISKLENGNYQFKSNNTIIFKNEKLIPLNEFLIQNKVTQKYL